jgi:hypothetical protein
MDQIRARFVVNDMNESRSAYSLELVPSENDPYKDNLYSGYPTGIIRLSPVKKVITDILNVGMEVDIIFEPVKE